MIHTVVHVAIEVFFASCGVFALWVIVREIRKVL